MQSTFADFKRDWSDFRKKLGERTFWDLPVEERDKWFSALSQVYLMMEPLGELEAKMAVQMFTSVSDEYARRSTLVLSLELKKLLK